MKSNTLRRFLILALAPLVSVALFTACSDDEPSIVDPGNGNGNGNGNGEQNIVEIASGDPRFSTLVELVADAGLADALSTDELTVFAPTNEAFDNLFATLDELDIELTSEQIVAALTYHVTEGSIPSSALEASQDVVMLNEERTLIQASVAGVLINGRANVIEADIQASNGVIHAIDEVILPTELRVAVEGPSLVELAAEAGEFETLISLVEQGGLTTTLQFLGPYTAFAPNDDAFDALFAEVDPATLSEEQVAFILTYHVIVGASVLSTDLEPAQTVQAANEEPLYITATEEGVFVNGSTQVIDADLEAANGVIHVVEDVLLPDAFLPVTGIVAKNYNLTTLLGLVAERAEILAALSGDGTFTVFAPTNEAFEAALAAFPDLTDEQITEILTYHVLTDIVLSGDLSDGQTAETLQEEEITVTIDGETVQINDANVITVDLEGTNGVVHIIDAVLVPPSYTAED
jgi:transforming growth factor-beta-induced protein